MPLELPLELLLRLPLQLPLQLQLELPNDCHLSAQVISAARLAGRRWETRSLPSETLNVPARIYPQLQINMRAVRKFEQYISDVFTPQGILSLCACRHPLPPPLAAAFAACPSHLPLPHLPLPATAERVVPGASIRGRCATSSLLVPRDALGERLAITLTMVLASIAFKSTVNASIPSVAYMTWTDTYINTNFYFLCATRVHSWPQPSLIHSRPPPLSPFLLHRCTLVAADLIFVFLPDDQTWSSLSSYLSFQSNSNAQVPPQSIAIGRHFGAIGFYWLPCAATQCHH